MQRKFCGRDESQLSEGKGIIFFANKISKCLCQEGVDSRKDTCFTSSRSTMFPQTAHFNPWAVVTRDASGQ